MRRLIAIIAALGLFSVGATAQIKEVKTNIYSIVYSEEYQQPLIIDYVIFCKPYSPSYDRDGISFKTYPGLVTSSNSDYANSIYDKGHMAPASTFGCTEEWLELTFSYVNCAIQHRGLNRGAWAQLERFERNLAGIYDDIEVRIEVFFSDQWTDNEDPARIPASFVKSISWVEDGKHYTISFDFPNEDTSGKSFWQFQIK